MSVAVSVAVAQAQQAPPPLYPSYYYQPQVLYRRASSRPCCRYFLGANVISFVVVGLVILVLHRVFRPRPPNFRVESLSLSNFSLASTSSLTGTCDVWFAVSNPNNKLSILYDSVGSALYYKSELISSTLLQPFQQGTPNQMVLEASFSEADTYVHSWIVDDINADMARGTVSFDVNFQANVEFGAPGYNAGTRELGVWWQGLVVRLSSNSSGFGTMVARARNCMVQM